MLHVGREKSSDLLWNLPVAVSNPHWDWTWTGKAYPSTWRPLKSICEARTKSTPMVFSSIKQNKAESWHKEDTDPPSLKEMGAPWTVAHSQAQHREEVEEQIKGSSAPNNLLATWNIYDPVLAVLSFPCKSFILRQWVQLDQESSISSFYHRESTQIYFH